MLALALTGLAGGGAAPAPDFAAPDFAAQASAFAALCFGNAFPAADEPHQAGLPAGAGLTRLTAPEAREILHGDPGQGWIYRSGERAFVVTIEAPPYHACSVRGVYPAPPVDHRSQFRSVVEGWASQQARGALTIAGIQTRETKPVTVRTWAAVLPAGADGPREFLLNIETADPGGKTEIRLVRSIPHP